MRYRLTSPQYGADVIDDGDEEDDEASPEEVLSMALHLGMNPLDPEDEALLWIAAEAYDAPLPDNWTEHFDWQGKVYFFCKETDTVSRDHPLDEFYRQLYREYRSRGNAHAATGRGDDESAKEEDVRAAAAARVHEAGGTIPRDPTLRLRETAVANIGGSVVAGAGGVSQFERQEHQTVDASPRTNGVSAPSISEGEPKLPSPSKHVIDGLQCDGEELALVVAPQRTDFEAAGSAAIVALRERLERAEAAAAEARTKALEERFDAEISALRDQLSRAEERAASAEKLAAEEREKAQVMVMKALEAATSLGAGENKRVGDMHEMLLAKERELHEALARARTAEDASIAAKAREVSFEERLKSRDVELEAEKARVRDVQKEIEIKAVEMERAKLQLQIEATAAANEQHRQTMASPRVDVDAVAAAASKAAEDAEEQIFALRRKVSNLEQSLDDEKARARKERSSQQDEIESLRGKMRLSAKFVEKIRGIQTQASDLKTQKRSLEEEMRQLQLYTFTKMEHCGAIITKVGAQLEKTIKERDHLKAAVSECDLRIGPLIREKRRLFNELLTAKGNIRVFCRVRPINEREVNEGAQEAVTFPPDDGANRLIRLVGKFTITTAR